MKYSFYICKYVINLYKQTQPRLWNMPPFGESLIAFMMPSRSNFVYIIISTHNDHLNHQKCEKVTICVIKISLTLEFWGIKTPFRTFINFKDICWCPNIDNKTSIWSAHWKRLRSNVCHCSCQLKDVHFAKFVYSDYNRTKHLLSLCK